MESKDLIGMVDYVLELKEKPKNGIFTDSEWFAKKLDEVTNYAQFLKQPLKLSMFIPCNDKDEPLEETWKTGWIDYENPPPDDYMLEERIEYQKALDNVIFEGFERYEGTWVDNEKIILLKNNGIYLNYNKEEKFFFENMDLHKTPFRKIEDLAGKDLNYKTLKQN